MKDYRSIALNIVESIYYKRWAATLIQEYSSAINKPFILDVGCGSNKISNSKMITGCDMFPVSDDIIQAAADDLPFESGTIDMLVSAHCLEHMANPIKTINEWCRAVGRDGVIWFILPHGLRTFDKLRPLTSSHHIFDDFNNDTTEHDQTHWAEFRDLTILTGHRLIPPEYIEKAKKDDFEYFNSQRLIHHHVWTLSSFIDLLLRLNLEILYATDLVPGRKDSFSVIVRSKFNG
jgi:SAM-dependent methyltransferase